MLSQSEARAVANLVGILTESGGQTFAGVMAEGARIVAEAAVKAGVRRFVRISAIGARKNSPSTYACAKAEGEAAVRELVPEAVIFRPSIVLGPEDAFFKRFSVRAKWESASLS